MTVYERFSELLKNSGVRVADITRATGIKSTVFSEWKSGKSQPKADKMQKIADYFNVSLDYLMTGIEMRMESKVTDHPCLHDLAFMDHVFKLWSLPLERRDAVFQQIQFQLDAYDKEIKEKEKVSNA